MPKYVFTTGRGKIVLPGAKDFETLAREHGVWVPGGGVVEGIRYDVMVRIAPKDKDFESILKKVLSGVVDGEVRIPKAK